MIYIVRDRETGTPIEWTATREEAEKILEKFEETDRKEGTFTEDFYEIHEADEPTIKDLRHLTGLSQAKFCQKYDIPLRTLQDWELGRRNAADYFVKLLYRVVMEDIKKEEEMESKIWYAVMRDREDNDWGYGSFDLEEAKKMARNMGGDAYIVVIDDGDDPVAIEEITDLD